MMSPQCVFPATSLIVFFVSTANAAVLGPRAVGGSVPAQRADIHNFMDYVAAHGRPYRHGTEEFTRRHAVFKQRLNLIQDHNAREDRLWTAHVNHLTDRTEDELAQLRGWRRSGPTPGSHEARASQGAISLLMKGSTLVRHMVDEVDWRNLSAAFKVPDQGACGSCWAVATASMLEARHEIQRRQNRSFSVQQLVNCVPNPHACGGTGGCDGATVELAMKYVQHMGLREADQEPYNGVAAACPSAMQWQANAGAATSLLSNLRGRRDSAAGLSLDAWQKLPENQALPLMQAAREGPVAISVSAADWFLYGTGIYNGCSRDAVIDHAVVLYGYGKEVSKGSTVKYWLVRNSWGNAWGEKGFIRLLRLGAEKDDQFCGIDSDPKAGTACSPYPDKVKVCGMCGILYDSVAANFVSV
eukprot:TRINITY_DN526_c0_g1_i1.p1 TRINITY_DN526_c0_g1~~TRINITY_DN526_c0_g1_i1.p1  ORF type:complete len:414 (+),score=73.53 TRINITY_DN526_c0_g1_i1:93-1334(+)